jgi:3-(3-hydroxy-phenyl)propionate hydroxylase
MRQRKKVTYQAMSFAAETRPSPLTSPLDPVDPVEDACEVAVVGLGPVGATLAALLGERGVDVIVIEPDAAPLPYPRAIAADDEMLRTMLRVPGLPDPLGVFATDQRVDARGPKGELLTTVAFGIGQLGVPGLSFFHQPSLERALRIAVDRAPTVRRRIGTAVTRLDDISGGVRLTLDDGAAVTAHWVVGCDGAGSLVRRERGIGYGGRSFAEPWVVVDIDCPEPLPHLPCFTYLLDPRRPAVNMPRPGGHRFEFMLLPGDDPATMSSPANVERWLAPYLEPLPKAVRAGLETVRATVYTFHVRTAERWRDGRVLLAGDAAHCMPPFGGQGLGAGIGDVVSLAWRLDEVRRGLSPPRVLDDYERERRPRVAEMTRTALLVGRLLTATSRPRAAATRSILRAVDRLPVVGQRLRSGGLRSRPRLPAPSGERCGGRPLPNPRVRTRRGVILRLDDLLGSGWTLLGDGVDPWLLLDAGFSAALRERQCCALVVYPPGGLRRADGSDYPSVEDLDGTLLALFRGRRRGVALVRPDRFLAAVDRAPQVAAAFGRLTGSTTAGA